MKSVAKFALLASSLTCLSNAHAAVYQCKVNGKTEYRDTPCSYQNAGSSGQEIEVKTTKKSGTVYKIAGNWCQYAKADQRGGSRSMGDPKDWLFSQGTVSYSTPHVKDKQTGQYTIASDFIQVSNAAIGSWFIEQYSSSAMTLTSSNQGVRYLKRGTCVVRQVS
ncbi:DUF4124 domain-containing protein [Catenovulum sp. SM1970]|uniref:DUF4124 domain-containing protein n=1 Tax=Marinifaba aquimaris TaxID=2741323 RepID=UPI0015723600|nr:DUF4124 domain-containing protein [Marinifaba aquimaris]NTS77427.1 DUF4124 domain-containing protein [Marinifaba aquimaris]